ncbi:flavodoxin [uncultured Blautia sp.]|nr:flavodoxin [uncultured Blautia sp.]
MREWCSRCEAAGANLYDEAGLIANDSPNEEAREACRELGRKLAAW